MNHHLRNKRFPLTIVAAILSPIVITATAFSGADCEPEQTELIPYDNAQNHQFGYFVTMDGPWLAIGTPVHPGQGNSAGAVYVYHWDGGGWESHSPNPIFAPGASFGDNFGGAVAMENGTMVVGAPGYDGLPGNSNTGAAYVYRLNADAGVFEFQQKLEAPSPTQIANFGYSVAISDGAVVIGAPHNTSTSLSDPQSPAYIFRENSSGTFIHEANLVPSQGVNTFRYGRSVAIAGNRAVVGAYDTMYGTAAGAAHLFQKLGSTWTQTHVLRPPQGDAQAYDRFGEGFAETAGHLGHAIAMEDDLIVIGAPGSNSPFTATGAAYVYRAIGTEVELLQKLVAENPIGATYMGTSVAISGSKIALGGHIAWGGSVFTFVSDDQGNSWEQSDQFIAAEIDDEFGCSVAISENRLAIGARFHDATADKSGIVYTLAPYTGGSAGSDPCDPNSDPDEPTCAGDLNLDSMVDVTDLLTMLAAWGPCSTCVADLNDDGRVDVTDLLLLLSAWGACP